MILLVTGSTRAGSTNTALLRAVASLAPDAVLYDGLATLPHFDPDLSDEPPAPVTRLRSMIAEADAVLFCTPEYAGALPGSFKNLLDWTVGGGEMYGKAVAWVNVSASPTGAASAHASLATVLGYLGTDVIEPACVAIPVARGMVGADGLVADAGVREQVGEVLAAIRRHTTAP